jgi:hypothetical protein
LEFHSKNFVTYFAIKVTTDWWNFFYNAKSGKYHSPEKQPFPSELSLYNLWSCFLPPFWSHSGDGYTMTELVTWHRDVVRDGPSESLSQLGMGVVVELVMGVP